MRNVNLILGGARSGKSTFALAEASRFEGRKAFIATAEAKDKEMKTRILNHKKERGPDWTTFEEPILISQVLTSVVQKWNIVIIDCLTLWISNVLHARLDIYDAVDVLARAVSQESPARLYIVSNEVGLGIVPDSELSRMYRDALGYANRRVAEAAQNVYFMVAGIPLQIKGASK